MGAIGREQVLAFRAARQGLGERRPLTLAAAAACPASDFARGSALLALAARAQDVTRAAYDAAVDAGELVVAPSLRAAIHAVAPPDLALYGRALIAEADDELGRQLGASARDQLRAAGIAPRAALAEVAAATADALGGGAALTKDELHAALRERVQPALLPWCKGCGSHHVAPMVWRYAGVQAGMRTNADRRFVGGGLDAVPPAAEAARRFLRFYAPAAVKDFATWAGLAPAHGRRIWAEIADELAEVRVDGGRAWALAGDVDALAAPPAVHGVRLLPARDPLLQHPDRTALAPDPAVRKRLFRPVAGPGAVLADGHLAGLWRARARGRRAEIEVETLAPADRGATEAEAARIAALRGADEAVVTWR